MNTPKLQKIEKRASRHYESVIESIYPEGFLDGSEFHVGDIHGKPGRSLAFNIDTGLWADFADSQTGNGVIDLLAQKKNISKSESAKKVEKIICKIKRQPSAARSSKKKVSSKWGAQREAPHDERPPTFSLPGLGSPSGVWIYTSQKGGVAGYICRYDRNGSKEIRPFSWCLNEEGRGEWKSKAMAKPRPLYALDHLFKHKGLPVLLVEGERAADAAQRVLPGWVVCTWSGGCKAVGKTDFSILEGRSVTLWPDADEPGKEAMRKIARKIRGKCRILKLPENLEGGWDVADLIEEGADEDDVESFISEHAFDFEDADRRSDTSSKEAVEAYYDRERKEYLFKSSDGTWASYTAAQFKIRLKSMGFSSIVNENERVSEVDQLLLAFQDNHWVNYSGKLCGKLEGFYRLNGNRIIVTESPQFIEPQPGRWDTVRALIEGVLKGNNQPDLDDIQWNTFMGWLGAGVSSLRSGEISQAQAIALAGPAGCGKSLIQHQIITPCLGGRSAKAAPYMLRGSDFNGDLFEAEHLVLEDEFVNAQYQSRQNFASQLKVVTVSTQCVSCNRKHRHQINLPAWWRVSVSVNDDPEAIRVLPPLDDHVADKIIILRASKKEMPMPTRTLGEQEAFRKKIVEELPAFLFWLLKEFEVPESLRDPRYGVKAFHHPYISEILSEQTPEARIWEIIESSNLDGSEFGNEKLKGNGIWRGTALELENQLRHGAYEEEVKRLTYYPSAMGTYLGRLSKLFPDRVRKSRTSDQRSWEITFPRDGDPF